MALERGAVRVIALAALVGALRIGWLHFAVEEQRVPIDARYAQAKAALPGRGRIGYRSDRVPQTEAWFERHTQAAYALAPLQLLPDDGKGPLLLDASDAAALEALRAEAGAGALSAAAGGVGVALRAAK